MENEKISLIDGVFYLSILGDFAFAFVILYTIFKSDVEHFVMSIILFSFWVLFRGCCFISFVNIKFLKLKKRKRRIIKVI